MGCFPNKKKTSVIKMDKPKENDTELKIKNDQEIVKVRDRESNSYLNLNIDQLKNKRKGKSQDLETIDLDTEDKMKHILQNIEKFNNRNRYNSKESKVIGLSTNLMDIESNSSYSKIKQKYEKSKEIDNSVLYVKKQKNQKIINEKSERRHTAERQIKISSKSLISKIEKKVEQDYKILCDLGKGTFGKVCKVFHIPTGMTRAMKVIKREMIEYQDDDKKFLKEIEILIKLDHPNIIRIYEYYIDSVNYYLITEYVSGGELYEIISKSKSFSEEKVIFILKQIMSAVYYLHSMSIVHRDIKPENILMENEKIMPTKRESSSKLNDYSSSSNKNKSKGIDQFENLNLKLIDFGTCNYFTNNKKLTLKVGTPYYIAPEVLRRQYNEKCDIWSCGVIMYILLVGYPPFKGKNNELIYNKVLLGKYNMKGNEWKRVSESGKDLVIKMLTYDPEKRPSAQQVLSHEWFSKQNKLDKNVDMNLMANVIKNIKNFNAKEKLQQATIAYIVHFLYTSKEFGELKNIFKKFDKNGDGRLTYQELKEGFQTVLGNQISEGELNNIIEYLDQDIDGYIEYQEFLRVTLNRKVLFNEENLKHAFNMFDNNKDGKLSAEEIKNILKTSNNEYVSEIIEEMDKNKDGEISFHEFSALMKSTLNNPNSKSRKFKG